MQPWGSGANASPSEEADGQSEAHLIAMAICRRRDRVSWTMQMLAREMWTASARRRCAGLEKNASLG